MHSSVWKHIWSGLISLDLKIFYFVCWNHLLAVTFVLRLLKLIISFFLTCGWEFAYKDNRLKLYVEFWLWMVGVPRLLMFKDQLFTQTRL